MKKHPIIETLKTAGRTGAMTLGYKTASAFLLIWKISTLPLLAVQYFIQICPRR